MSGDDWKTFDFDSLEEELLRFLSLHHKRNLIHLETYSPDK